MKSIVCYIGSLLLLLLLSCTSDEKIVDNTIDELTLLISRDDGSNEISIIKFPENRVIRSDVFYEINGKKLNGKVKKIEEFGCYIYLLIPSEYLIEVIDSKTYVSVATIDFKSVQLEPTDISFHQASTSAYICHGNDSSVSELDTKFMKIAKTIKVGISPVSVVCTGNRIYTANQKSDDVTVIEYPDNVIATIKTYPVPLFIDSKPNNKEVVVVSAGTGKLDSLNEKSPAFVSYIDVATNKIIKFLELGYQNEKAINQIPLSFSISISDKGFAATNNVFLRIDTERRDRISFISKKIYNYVFYNMKKQQLILLSDENNIQEISIADKSSGVIQKSYQLPIRILAFCPL